MVYTQIYDVEDVTEASIDGLAVAVITVVSFVGVIVLFAVATWGYNKFKKGL